LNCAARLLIRLANSFELSFPSAFESKPLSRLAARSARAVVELLVDVTADMHGPPE
jgi:hypothetical protein